MSTPTKTTLDEEQRQALRFTGGSSVRFTYLCPNAQAFTAWCEELVKPVREQPAEITVNVALLHLQDNFFARHETTGEHEPCDNLSEHPDCLFEVYQSYFVELRTLRWKVNPPLLRPPPAPPPPPQIAGVAFGIKK